MSLRSCAEWGPIPIHTERESRFAGKFPCKSSDVACKLCEHSHSQQCAPLLGAFYQVFGILYVNERGLDQKTHVFPRFEHTASDYDCKSTSHTACEPVEKNLCSGCNDWRKLRAGKIVFGLWRLTNFAENSISNFHARVCHAFYTCVERKWPRHWEAVMWLAVTG